MKSFLLIIILLISTYSFSQEPLLPALNGRMSAQTERQFLDIIHKSRKPVTLKDSDIIGSRYYNENFTFGKITLDSVQFSKDFAMRYNAFADEIEVDSGEEIDILTRDTSISCTIGNKNYIYLPYIEKDSNYPKMGYLITVFEGKNIKLYSREVKIFKEGRKAKTSLTTSIPPKLVDFEYFLISKNNETPRLIKPKSNEVLKLVLDEFQLELKTFIKENNLKLKKRKDLITFIKKYDMLLSN
jgi:hypothetical protein